MKPVLAQLRRFVGNPGAYSVQSPDGSWHPVREPLNAKVLLSHLAKEQTVGTYIGHRPLDSEHDVTVARTLCFDIDIEDAAEASVAAGLIGDALEQVGFPLWSWGTEDSGRRGRHVWVVLATYVSNIDLRRMGRAVLALSGVSCELYPKQDQVRDLGSLVKLPGGVHQVSGRENNFLDRIPRPLPISEWQALLDQLPPEVHARRVFADSRFPCMQAIQDEGVQEGGRNTQLFHLAVMLRRAGVTAEFTELTVRTVNERCTPPLEDFELEQLLVSAATSGPICQQLPENRQCGELCLLTRTSGLYTRPGLLRHASAGENVVVTVVSHNGKVVELEHDDVSKMRGILSG